MGILSLDSHPRNVGDVPYRRGNDPLEQVRLGMGAWVRPPNLGNMTLTQTGLGNRREI